MNVNVEEYWAIFERTTAESLRRNTIIVFEALSTAGITHVRVGFDGEGDQGQMERAAARMNGNAVEFPTVTVKLWESRYGSAELRTCELGLQEAVENLCYGCLEERYGGWEINEGSFGEFNLDVAARTIRLEHYGRFVETAYSSDTF